MIIDVIGYFAKATAVGLRTTNVDGEKKTSSDATIQFEKYYSNLQPQLSHFFQSLRVSESSTVKQISSKPKALKLGLNPESHKRHLYILNDHTMV
jgi:hypothetical protein